MRCGQRLAARERHGVGAGRERDRADGRAEPDVIRADGSGERRRQDLEAIAKRLGPGWAATADTERREAAREAAAGRQRGDEREGVEAEPVGIAGEDGARERLGPARSRPRGRGGQQSRPPWRGPRQGSASAAGRARPGGATWRASRRRERIDVGGELGSAWRAPWRQTQVWRSSGFAVMRSWSSPSECTSDSTVEARRRGARAGRPRTGKALDERSGCSRRPNRRPRAR